MTAALAATSTHVCSRCEAAEATRTVVCGCQLGWTTHPVCDDCGRAHDLETGGAP